MCCLCPPPANGGLELVRVCSLFNVLFVSAASKRWAGTGSCARRVRSWTRPPPCLFPRRAARRRARNAPDPAPPPKLRHRPCLLMTSLSCQRRQRGQRTTGHDPRPVSVCDTTFCYELLFILHHACAFSFVCVCVCVCACVCVCVVRVNECVCVSVCVCVCV